MHSDSNHSKHTTVYEKQCAKSVIVAIIHQFRPIYPFLSRVTITTTQQFIKLQCMQYATTATQ